MRLIKVCLLPLLYICTSFCPAVKSLDEHTYTISVVITNLRSNKGRIQLDLYKNQEEFKARQSDGKRRAYVDKSKMKDGYLVYQYKGVPKGVYGLALYDDENANGKFDYGVILPSEGFGFGNYYHTSWTSPHFNDFKFTLSANKNVVMMVRYL